MSYIECLGQSVTHTSLNTRIGHIIRNTCSFMQLSIINNRAEGKCKERKKNKQTNKLQIQVESTG